MIDPSSINILYIKKKVELQKRIKIMASIVTQTNAFLGYLQLRNIFRNRPFLALFRKKYYIKTLIRTPVWGLTTKSMAMNK